MYVRRENETHTQTLWMKTLMYVGSYDLKRNYFTTLPTTFVVHLLVALDF
jgi:hypothetical protein